MCRGVNQLRSRWLGKHSIRISHLRRSSSRVRGTKTFGTPRSPSNLGSRIRGSEWSRKVFQVSSLTTRWSWCRSSSACVSDEVGRERLQRLEVVLQALRLRAESSCREAARRGSRHRFALASSRAAAARVSASRSPSPLSVTQTKRAAGIPTHQAQRQCRHIRSRCRRNARRRKGSSASVNRIRDGRATWGDRVLSLDQGPAATSDLGTSAQPMAAAKPIRTRHAR